MRKGVLPRTPLLAAMSGVLILKGDSDECDGLAGRPGKTR